MVDAKTLKNAGDIDPATFTDFGEVPTPLGEPVSRESGLILFQNDDKSSEMGLWQCTPGSWRCEVKNDEFFYVLAGRAIYNADDGTVTEIGAGMTCAFPAGWKGDCKVVETIRKVYMAR
jgi:uncharacterized cupin superfamily protein